MRFREVLGGRRRLIQSAIGVAAVLAPPALAGPASAASLSVTKPCYVDSVANTGKLRPAAMTVIGSGYTPNSSVTIKSSDGSVDAQVPANATGNINATIGAPTPHFNLPGSQVQQLSAADGPLSASTFVKDTELAVATMPATAKPTKRVTWYFSGFRTGRLVFGHYLFKNHQVALSRFGRAKGVCGLLRVKARFYPGKQTHKHYGLQFDDVKHYSKHSTPRIDTSLNTA